MFKIQIVTLILGISLSLFSQTEKLNLSLSEVVALAQSDAPDVLLSKTNLTRSTWFYKTYQAQLKPDIFLFGNLAEINRGIGVVTLDDGTDKFLQRSSMRNFLGLSLTQRIPWTGGRIYARSRVSRLDVFQESASNFTNYLSTPFAIGFDQPLFGFNELKWDKEIEPLKYNEATKEFAEDMENVAYESVEFFFDVFIAQLNLEAANRNKSNADTLFSISKGRFEVGRIAETELLQIELSAMNGDANVAQELLNFQSSTEDLRNFLGIKNVVAFDLSPPTDIPDFSINGEDALKYALQNRSQIVGFERRLKVAERDVAEAKANSGLNVNVSGEFNLSQTGEKLSDAYSELLDNEIFSISLNVPIADWGKSKAAMELARANQEYETMSVEQERINFERGISLKVQQFDLVRNQVRLAKRAYDVSIKREDITRKRYYIGKIGITDLNLAIGDKENARKSYMDALRSFWLAYYDMRRITLVDFKDGKSLVRKGD